jgi:hypothetical protein
MLNPRDPANPVVTRIIAMPFPASASSFRGQASFGRAMSKTQPRGFYAPDGKARAPRHNQCRGAVPDKLTTDDEISTRRQATPPMCQIANNQARALMPKLTINLVGPVHWAPN